MQKSDRLAAVFFIVLSLVVCQQSMAIGVGTLHRPGPALLSFGAGAGIGLLALAVLVLSFFQKGAAPEPEPEGGGTNKRKTILISLSLFAYTFAVTWLGFSLATFAFVLFLFRLVETEKWWHSLGKAALVTLGNYLLFIAWLGINFPKGILPW